MLSVLFDFRAPLRDARLILKHIIRRIAYNAALNHFAILRARALRRARDRRHEARHDSEARATSLRIRRGVLLAQSPSRICRLGRGVGK